MTRSTAQAARHLQRRMLDHNHGDADASDHEKQPGFEVNQLRICEVAHGARQYNDKRHGHRFSQRNHDRLASPSCRTSDRNGYSASALRGPTASGTGDPHRRSPAPAKEIRQAQTARVAVDRDCSLVEGSVALLFGSKAPLEVLVKTARRTETMIALITGRALGDPHCARCGLSAAQTVPPPVEPHVRLVRSVYLSAADLGLSGCASRPAVARYFPDALPLVCRRIDCIRSD